MQDTRQGLTLRDYLAPLVARRWVILAVVVLTTVATYGYYAEQAEVFEASTKVYVAEDANPVLGTSGLSDDRTVENQATLLRSTDVAASVAERIGYTGSAGALAASVVTAPSEGSDFILLTAKGASGTEAAAIANGFAAAFVDLRSQDRRGAITKSLTQLRTQLDSVPTGAASADERAGITAQIRQLKVALSSATGAATQVDPAVAPATPVAPKPARNALFAFTLALLGSVFLAYFLERFDPRLRTVDEAAAIYDRPVLASIVHDADVVYFSEGVPAISPMSKEAFRQLRVALQLADPGRPLKTILVTSASSGEGKSTVVRNLGLALHEAGRRVALIDADLRKPTLTTLLAAKPRAGLMDAMTGDRRLDEILTRVEVESRGVADLGKMTDGAARAMAGDPGALTLVAAGPRPANPPAALESPAARKLLADIAATHDTVIVDTPPVLEVSDAIPLLSQVDAVLLVVRPGVTQRRSAQRALQTITRVEGVNFLGVVANDLTGLEASAYGGRYGYGYGRTDAKQRGKNAAGDSDSSPVASVT